MLTNQKIDTLVKQYYDDYAATLAALDVEDDFLDGEIARRLYNARMDTLMEARLISADRWHKAIQQATADFGAWVADCFKS